MIRDAVLGQSAANAPSGRCSKRLTDFTSATSYVVAQVGILCLLATVAPRFFLYEPMRLTWFSDAQAQFLPVMRWAGRQGETFAPLLIDPDVGSHGNFLADFQYGVLDPLHWPVFAILAATEDLVAFSWGFAGVLVTLFGVGLLAILRRSEVGAFVAVAATLGASTSGFLMFFGSDWWPVLFSLPFFCWLWYGLLRRDGLGAALAGVSTWGLITGANIYLVPFGVLLVVTVFGRQAMRRRSVMRLLRERWAVGALVAMVGGTAVAAPTLLAVVEMSSAAVRPSSEYLFGNSGFGVPNFLDVVLGGASMHAIANDWLGVVQQSPAFFTFVVALPALAFVSWRRALKDDVVLVALVLTVSAALATQLPSVHGPLRIPFRYELVVAIVLPVLAAVATHVAPAFSRSRTAAAVAIVILQSAVALSRTPVLIRWHVLAMAVSLVALLALVVVLRSSGPGARIRRVAGVVLVVGAASQLFIGYGQNIAVNGRIEAADPTHFRFAGSGYDLGGTVSEYRKRSLVVDGVATVVKFDAWDGPDRTGFPDGVVYGQANLVAGFRTGFGYSAVQHSGIAGLECGGRCGTSRLLEDVEVGGSTRKWIDVSASDDVYVSREAPGALMAHLHTSPLWVAEDDVRGWAHFVRAEPLVGRITVADGAVVSEELSTVARLGQDQERYVVSTNAEGAILTLRVPYWPGYSAAVDGVAVPVTALSDALLQVELPAGLDEAAVVVRFEPLAARLFWPLVGGGLLLILTGALLGRCASHSDGGGAVAAHADGRTP